VSRSAAFVPAYKMDQIIKKELKDAAETAEDASKSRALVIAARAGFAVSGLLHVLIGSIALQLAMGRGGQADAGGAMAQLASQQAGTLLLWSCFAACVALSVWQIGNAVFSFGNLQAGKRLGKKLGAGGQAAVFALLAVTLASFAVGAGKESAKSTSDLTVTVIEAPGGAVLLVAVGAAVAVAGIVFAVRGFRRSFEKDLRLPSPRRGRSLVTGLGVVGYFAKGIALLLVGLLIIIATATAHPQESTGLDGGLKALRDQPYGLYMLAVMGAGLGCYGLYLMVKAKIARM
jgi:hypothetical protein